MNRIYQVKELTLALKNLLEGDFPFVWVQGQVANISRPSSGHLYFSLKDEESSIAAVWFRGNQQEAENFDPLTGEVFESGPRPGLAGRMENGMEALCAGRLTVYPPRGSYQIVVELMQEAGTGRLQLQFELLKAKLARQGYFDPQRKRNLPSAPRRVALITSPGGAAVHDFLRISATRGLPGEIRLYPALVQGDEAVVSIAEALRKASSENWAELIVLIRGGGSKEDLRAFNSREVAQAVFESALPVLSGIGHEIDTTLADMVADVRAATPTHAAQILWPERRVLVQRLDDYEIALRKALAAHLTRAEQLVAAQEQRLHLLAPFGRLDKAEFLLKVFTQRLSGCMRLNLDRKTRDLEPGSQKLLEAMSRKLDKRGAQLDNLALRLQCCDPVLPLQRGYAFINKADGSLLRSSKEAGVGEHLQLRLVDGVVPVVVTIK
ncbi:MAG: exodeoxyribonuclease VII large subunit [Deltaproteobacteria bacterium]|jgi:exodeoxyribonuclease VII large subunit|nr:exodeoxyribonuclease VII large subunit [Deltaproteobacteria bacterium]